MVNLKKKEFIDLGKKKSEIEDYILDLKDDLNFNNRTSPIVKIKRKSNTSEVSQFIGRFYKSYPHFSRRTGEENRSRENNREIKILKNCHHIEINGSIDVNFDEKNTYLNKIITGDKDSLLNMVYTIKPYIDELLDRIEDDGGIPFSYFSIYPHTSQKFSKVFINILVYFPNSISLKKEFDILYKKYIGLYQHPLNNMMVNGYKDGKIGQYVKNFKDFITIPGTILNHFWLYDKFPILK